MAHATHLPRPSPIVTHSTIESFRRFLDPTTLTHIMYHAQCYDGLSAAWVSLLFARKRKLRVPTLVPVRAGQTWSELVESCPDILATPDIVRCLFVDVAPSMEIVLALRRLGIVFGILDHHKSNARELSIPEACYKLDRAGCILSYQYFFGATNDSQIPWILQYIEDQDTFKWRRGRESFLFHLAWSSNVSRTPEQVFDMLDTLSQRSPESETLRISMIGQGYSFLSFIENEAERVVTDAKIMSISLDHGISKRLVLCSNYSTSLMHDVAHELVQKAYDMVVFWRKSSRTGLFHSTLVTCEGRQIDVSRISSQLASLVGGTGGGHELCAGMQTRINPEILLERFHGKK